jgi:hypothetical protein
MGHGGAESQVIELVVARAQANLDVGQTLAKGDLGKAHGQKLIPAGEVTDPVMAVVASHAAAKLFRVDPVHELREDGFARMHAGSLASTIAKKIR